MKMETLAVRAGFHVDPTTKAVVTPIYQTTSYAFDNTCLLYTSPSPRD